MPATDRASTLGDLVVAQPGAAALFERLGLDYCCGGRHTLEEACGQKGLDAATVRTLLDALAEDPVGPEPHDLSRATIDEVCDHIVTRHHGPLRTDLQRITKLLATVVRVHGVDHRELHDLARLFATTREEIERHLDLEEQTLFPACRALDQGDRDATCDPALVGHLEEDHTATGDALAALRELAGDYRTDTAFCATHRSLLQALHAFETDMHQHVHEENNVLFPRVRERIAAAGR